MMAGSIQKTLEGECVRQCVCVCVCVRESKAALHCVEVDLWKEKKRWEREWREEGSQRIPPFHSTAPGGTSWAGTNWCEINFPVGYNDPERSHTSLDR